MDKELEPQDETKSKLQKVAERLRDSLPSWIREPIHWFAHTFVFYMLRSVFFVLLLVWFIFLFKPSSGFVHLVMDRLAGDAEFEADTVNIVVNPVEEQSVSASERTGIDAMSINTGGSCTLSLDRDMYLNGVKATPGDYLELTPGEFPDRSVHGGQIIKSSGLSLFGGSKDSAVIGFRAEEANVALPLLGSDGISNRDIVAISEELDISCKGTLHFRTIPNVKVELVHSDGTRAIIDPIANQAGTIFSLSGESPEGAQADEGNNDALGEAVGDDHGFVELDPNESPSEPWLLSVRALGESDQNVLRLKCSTVAGFSIDANRCRGVEARGDGKLSISYTPTPQEYVLQDQRVQLGELSRDVIYHAEDKGDLFVELSYDSDEQSLVVSGDVAKARLSGMNLFPDFRNWYFSNVYLAPSTIVSASFGVLAQTLTARKKNEEDDRKRDGAGRV